MKKIKEGFSKWILPHMTVDKVKVWKFKDCLLFETTASLLPGEIGDEYRFSRMVVNSPDSPYELIGFAHPTTIKLAKKHTNKSNNKEVSNIDGQRMSSKKFN